MKVLLALAVLVAVTLAAPAIDFEYATTYDFQALFKDDARRKIVLDCMLDKIPCGEYQKLKDNVFQILMTQCAECNDMQRDRYQKLTKQYHDQFESEYNQMMEKVVTSTIKKE